MFNFFKSNKKIELNSEFEFADITLHIENIAYEEGKIILDAAIPNEDPGFRIIVQDKTSKVVFDDSGKPTVTATPNGIIFKTLGKKSDDFLVFLSKEYGYEDRGIMMAEELALTSVAMEGDCSRLENEVVRFKLFNDKEFAEADDENEYFEIFLIIDIPNKKVELSEKDIDYRSSILKSLSQR